MKSLAVLQQSNSALILNTRMYAFPQVPRSLAFSKGVAPVSKVPETFFPIGSFDESNTRVILKCDELEQQEINVNWEEISSTVYTPEEQMKWIFVFYTAIREQEVWEFLESNEFLIPLVFDTFLNIKKYFSYSKVTLDVETDYEYPSHRELAAHVVTSLPLEEAFEQLDEFDDHWWILAAKKVKSKLYVDLRFE